MDYSVTDDELVITKPLEGTPFSEVVLELPKAVFVECFNKWIKEEQDGTTI